MRYPSHREKLLIGCFLDYFYEILVNHINIEYIVPNEEKFEDELKLLLIFLKKGYENKSDAWYNRAISKLQKGNKDMVDAGSKKAWEDIRYSFVIALIDKEINDNFGAVLREVLKVIDKRIAESS